MSYSCEFVCLPLFYTFVGDVSQVSGLSAEPSRRREPGDDTGAENFSRLNSDKQPVKGITVGYSVAH